MRALLFGLQSTIIIILCGSTEICIATYVFTAFRSWKISLIIQAAGLKIENYVYYLIESLDLTLSVMPF